MQTRKSMPITIMRLESFWERHRRQRWAPIAGAHRSGEARTPKPFQPLTHEESIAVLEHANQWLIDEARATVVLLNGPDRERRQTELWARYKSMTRDYARLARKQED